MDWSLTSLNCWQLWRRIQQQNLKSYQRSRKIHWSLHHHWFIQKILSWTFRNSCWLQTLKIRSWRNLLNSLRRISILIYQKKRKQRSFLLRFNWKIKRWCWWLKKNHQNQHQFQRIYHLLIIKKLRIKNTQQKQNYFLTQQISLYPWKLRRC